MDQLPRRPSLRNRRLSKSNTELFSTLLQLQDLIPIPTESSITHYLDLLKYLSSQISLEKEIQCSFIIISTSLLIHNFLSPASLETTEKLNEILSNSKALFQNLFNFFTKPNKVKVPQQISQASSDLLNKVRELFSEGAQKPGLKVKVLSKILSMVPSTPFELLLVALNNLLLSRNDYGGFPCFTYGAVPYLPEYGRKEYTLVLDLDETLVHLKENKVQVRPGAKEFIETASLHFELVLFTASVQEYADYVLMFVDPNNLIKLRLYRPHTTRDSSVSIKDLQSLGRDLSKVIIIDNLKESFQLQQQNGICIKSWTGESSDNELNKLLEFLITVPYKNLSHVSECLFPLYE